jgi:hypothetical protein
MVLSENILINPVNTVIRPDTPKSKGERSLEVIIVANKVITCNT